MGKTTHDYWSDHVVERMRSTNTLDRYKQEIMTPCIGVEFPEIDLAQLLKDEDSEAQIRDLAILLAERGVAIFRSQTNVGHEEHKQLIYRMGKYSGPTKEDTLYKFPLSYSDDPEVLLLKSSDFVSRYNDQMIKRQNHAQAWHTDSIYEPAPSDISSLRLVQFPEAGGDTMFCSAYELYDRLSEPYIKYLEMLEGTFLNPVKGPTSVLHPEWYKGERGHPLNVSTDLKCTHNLIRTHPVTGWRVINCGGYHNVKINDIPEDESKEILAKLQRMMGCNHDLQCRVKWKNPYDLTMWDNRACYHSATHDTQGSVRQGWRVLSAGEIPFITPSSKGRIPSLQDDHDKGIKDPEIARATAIIVPPEPSPYAHLLAKKAKEDAERLAKEAEAATMAAAAANAALEQPAAGETSTESAAPDAGKTAIAAAY